MEMDSRKDSRPQGVESSTSNPVHDTVVVPSGPSPAMGSSQIQGRVLPPLHQMLHGVSHGVADSVAIAPASQPGGPRNIQSGLVPPPTSSQLPRELLDYGNDSVSMQRSWESNSTYGWGAGIATGQSSTRGASNAPYPGERLIPLTQAPSGGHGLNMPSSRASFPSQSFTLSQWRGTESRQGTPWEPNMPSPHVRPATAWDPAGPWRSWGPPAQRQVPSFTGTPRTEFRTFAESQMPMIGMPSTQSTETASIWRGPSSTGQTGRSTNAGGVYQEHYTGSGGPSTSYLPSQSQHPMLTYSQGAPQPLDSREELRQYGNPAQRRIVSVPGDRYTHIVPNAQSYNPPPPFFNPPPQSAQLYLPPPSASHTHRSHPFLDGLTSKYFMPEMHSLLKLYYQMRCRGNGSLTPLPRRRKSLVRRFGRLDTVGRMLGICPPLSFRLVESRTTFRSMAMEDLRPFQHARKTSLLQYLQGLRSRVSVLPTRSRKTPSSMTIHVHQLPQMF